MFSDRFCRAEKGIALIFVTITLPAIIGFSLLAVDGARVYNLHNDLQKAADSFALAAAAELDGLADSKPRANLAIETLVENFSRFSVGGPITLTEADISVRFLWRIPDDDDEIFIPASMDSVTDTDARFVEVTVNPETLNSVFPASFLGASNTATVSASAVAGFTQGVCDFTPVYICNPYEDPAGGDIDSPTLMEAATSRDERRKLIYLRKQGGNGCQNGPGNYGFLEGPYGNGANALRDAIARANPPGCYSTSGVETETGFIASTRSAFNVRFDLYDANMNSKKNNPDFRPAMNVRKGYNPGASACGQSEVATPDPDTVENRQYMKLPRDNGLANDSCTSGRQGNGVWDFMKYMKVNHGNVVAMTDTQYVNRNGDVWDNSDANRPTRYDVYLEELHGIPPILDDPSGQHATTPPARPEVGSPACYSGGTLSNEPDRRLLYGAILNCIEHADDLVGGSGDPIPVVTFASFFITEPVDDSGGNASILVELVDVTGRGGLGTLEEFARDNVQLYR